MITMQAPMKNNLAGIFISLALCACLCRYTPGRAQPGAVKQLTEDDSGKKLYMSNGESFVLTVPDRVDGGFRFNKPSFDTSILKLQDHKEYPPQPNAPPGHSGVGTWQFTALKKGKTVLTITSSRPWAKFDSVTIFQNIVLVK
jgi:predicted secreted protein